MRCWCGQTVRAQALVQVQAHHQAVRAALLQVAQALVLALATAPARVLHRAVPVQAPAHLLVQALVRVEDLQVAQAQVPVLAQAPAQAQAQTLDPVQALAPTHPRVNPTVTTKNTIPTDQWAHPPVVPAQVHPPAVPAPAQDHHLQVLALIQALLQVVPAPAQVHHLQVLALVQAILQVVPVLAPAQVQALLQVAPAQAPLQAVQAQALVPALAQAQVKWLYKRRKKVNILI
jgi:hypothetical protein